MKYFIDERQRKAKGGTCYFEFQKGKFRNKFWLDDSLCLYADIFDSFELYKLFSGSIKEFRYYAFTDVSKEQWEILLAKSKENEMWKDIIEELRPWAEECFVKHKYFTILGI